MHRYISASRSHLKEKHAVGPDMMAHTLTDQQLASTITNGNLVRGTLMAHVAVPCEKQGLTLKGLEIPHISPNLANSENLILHVLGLPWLQNAWGPL